MYDGGFYCEEIVFFGELEMDEVFLKKWLIEVIIFCVKLVFDISFGMVIVVNSSGILDGVVVFFVLEEEKVVFFGYKLVFWFIGSVVSGIYLNYLFEVLVDVICKFLFVYDVIFDDIDLYEINEVFVVKICVCL